VKTKETKQKVKKQTPPLQSHRNVSDLFPLKLLFYALNPPSAQQLFAGLLLLLPLYWLSPYLCQHIVGCFAPH